MDNKTYQKYEKLSDKDIENKLNELENFNKKHEKQSETQPFIKDMINANNKEIELLKIEQEQRKKSS